MRSVNALPEEVDIFLGFLCLKIEGYGFDSVFKIDFTDDYSSTSSIFKKVGLTVPAESDAACKNVGHSLYRLTFKGPEAVCKATAAFLKADEYFSLRPDQIKILTPWADESLIAEWRPWRHQQFSPGSRAALRSLALLAKAREPGEPEVAEVSLTNALGN